MTIKLTHLKTELLLGNNKLQKNYNYEIIIDTKKGLRRNEHFYFRK
jgi:hypothetical protein